LLGRHDLGDELPGLGRPLGEELLEPCAIYATEVLALARDGLLHAAAHITGGGFFENIPRALPEGLGARIDRSAWPEPSIFGVLQEAGGLSDDDLFATFNMGVGLVLVVDPDQADEVLRRRPDGSFVIGSVVTGGGVRIG